MNSLALAAVTACAGLVLVTGAAATTITYMGKTTFGGGSFTIDATTDGATGDLSWSDFSTFTLTVTGGGETVSAVDGAAGVALNYTGGLEATPTVLEFDFSQPGNLFNYGSTSTGATICLGGADYGCGADTSPGEGFGTSDFSASRQVFTLTEIASAPEPGSWALMLVGVAGVGGSMRARRRALRAA